MHDTDLDDKAKPDHERLFQTASQQGGYFTAAQARTSGFSFASLSYHVRRGRFIRVRRGLYRLRQYPESTREDVIAAWLAAGRDDAVVSHESALDLLGLSDAVPDNVHLTLPRTMRYRPATPGVTIHTTTRPLRPEDIVIRDGIRVTSVVRSILDAAEAGTAPEQIVAAVREAINRGMTTRTQATGAARSRSRRVQHLVQKAFAGESE
ncbi:MAG: type IV toxin-antitoxin system AbiEi family antitoxin domain-containing protein [Actinomycetota bacterium]